MQPCEFVARRLIYTKDDRRRGSRFLLGTPLYVAEADELPTGEIE